MVKAAKSSPRPSRAAAAGSAPSAIVAGVTLTHPDRVLWDEQGITKQDLAAFYAGIADWILPHVVNRPLALVRCPSGSQKGCFFQKHSWAGLSDFIGRATVRSQDGEEEVLVIRDLSGLIALVQSGVLEIHPWGATIDDLERPDRVTFDFDPSEEVPWASVLDGARDLRERLTALGLESFPKTTGGKGLHVVVPLTPQAGWDEVLTFARDLSDAMEADSPGRYLTKAGKQDRKGRIFIDYLRNGRGATAVAAYSTRARPGAPVATPLAWDEMSPAMKSNQFTVSNLTERLHSLGPDPWARLRQVKQVLPAAKRTRSTKARSSD